MTCRSIVPYASIFIDADWKHFIKAAQWSIYSSHDRAKLIESICLKWMSKLNPNHVLPCLSVRTGFDLFLRVMNYPPGSEIIVSAVNIPDMLRIVHAHGLKIISLDIDIETLAPKIQLLDTLVTERTKVLVVASIYGRRFDMAPVVAAARCHGLMVVEDCAESFGGFDYLGFEGSDLALFSFGPIKHHTAFGGAIAKIRSKDIYDKMSCLYKTDPAQSRMEYLKKVIKCAIGYLFLDCPHVTKSVIYLGRLLNIDHKKFVVGMLRGFPDKLLQKLRHQPCDALLAMMALRLGEVDPTAISLSNLKHEYVNERLPSSVTQVGAKANVMNHWLCPIVVEQPDEVVSILNSLGVDAYRGGTQLNIVESDNRNDNHTPSHLMGLEQFVTHYPHEARYLIDHVIYLPVNKSVPFRELDCICDALSVAMASVGNGRECPHLRRRTNIQLKSKL